MISRYLKVTLPGSLLLAGAAFVWGGWATITVEDLPDYLIAGQPTTLEFTVRQHGVERTSGLKAAVVARSGKLETSVMALPGRKAGQYAAALTLPEAGDWTITIKSGFGPTNLTLMPIRAVAPGTQVASLPAPARGQRLFVAKGCVTCHAHTAVKSTGMEGAPELSERRLPAEYLARFLANPAAVKPVSRGEWGMPNLELKQQEIVALIAFLNPVQQATR
jgi:mono/diheme cytochrome c family protein